MNYFVSESRVLVIFSKKPRSGPLTWVKGDKSVKVVSYVYNKCENLRARKLDSLRSIFVREEILTFSSSICFLETFLFKKCMLVNVTS